MYVITYNNINGFVKYDLINESWTQITGSNPTARRSSIGLRSGNKFYVVGGYTNSFTDEVISYTLYSNTPNKMKHSSSILNGDEIVTVFGGSNSNTYYNSVYNFSLVDNNWSLITPTNDAIANSSEHGNSSGMPSPRHGHTSVKYNNKMYMFGGKDGSTTYYDTWEYDLTTTTWTKKALALSSHARYEHSSIIYNANTTLEEIPRNLIDDNLNGLIDENNGASIEITPGFFEDFYLYLEPENGTGLKYIDYFTSEGVDNPLIDESRLDGIDNDNDWDITTDDVGIDGLAGSGDLGENDGLPTSGAGTDLPGEPNIDKTDIDESDQIGLSSLLLF